MTIKLYTQKDLRLRAGIGPVEYNEMLGDNVTRIEREEPDQEVGRLVKRVTPLVKNIELVAFHNGGTLTIDPNAVGPSIKPIRIADGATPVEIGICMGHPSGVFIERLERKAGNIKLSTLIRYLNALDATLTIHLILLDNAYGQLAIPKKTRERVKKYEI